MSEVLPEEVDYFWPPYIAVRKVTLIEGDPEVGKSWLTLAIQAAASTGGNLLTHTVRKGKVLLCTAEDDLGDTVRVRLDQLNADPANIIVLHTPFTFSARGLFLLTTAIEEVALILSS